MPTASAGFTGTEIKTYVKDWIGNQSSEFDSLLDDWLPIAEYRFCRLHDWSFLHKTNLSLTVASGTAEYDLDTAAIGFEMQATNAKSVFSSANGVYLKKTTLEKIRRQDPEIDDGTTGQDATHWAPVGDKKIVIYPSIFSDTVLKIDGKIEPTALLTLSNTPTIPFRYQETFINYILAWALERDNDDRAARMKQEFLLQVRQDIQDDMAQQGGTDQPRIMSMDEADADGNQDEFDALNMWHDW